MALILLVQAALILVAVGRAGFFADDFVNHWIAREFNGLTLSYLLRSDYGHLSIGQRILHYLVLFKGRYSWELVMLSQVVFGLLISLSAFRMVRVLAGQWWAVAGTAVVAFSPLWADSWPWWSSGIDYFVSLPACFLALELACRRMLGGTRRLSLGVAVCMAVAFAFRERPAVLPVIYLLLAVSLYPDPLRVRKTTRYLASLWDLGLASSIVVAAYSWLLVSRGDLLDQLRNPIVAASGPGQVVRFLGTFLVRVFVPGLVGILPSAWPWPTAMAAAGALLAGSLALLAALLFPRGWRVVGLLVGAAVMSLLPVAIGRAAMPALALQPRYGVELLPVVSLVLALLGREWEAGRVRPSVAAAARSPGVFKAIRAGSLLALIGVVAVGIFSALRYEQRWNPLVEMGLHPNGPAIVETASAFRRSVRALRTGPGETIVDGLIPPSLLLLPPEKNAGWGTLSSVVSRARPEVSVGRLPAELVSVIESDGSIRSYRTGPTATVSANALLFSGAAVHPPAEGPFCGNREKVGVALPLASGSREAVLIEVLWGVPARPPMWLAPIHILASGIVARGIPVPGALTSSPTAAVVRVEPGTTAAGFELPDGFDGCIAGLRVTGLTAAPPPNGQSSRFPP